MDTFLTTKGQFLKTLNSQYVLVIMTWHTNINPNNKAAQFIYVLQNAILQIYL